MKFKITMYLSAIFFINYLICEDSISCRQLYLDLIKKILINSIYQDPNMLKISPLQYNQKNREEGHNDWPLVAHTMIGLKRLNNIQNCAEDVLKNNIPGDFLEAGVWRGGAVIFMRAILKTYNITNRNVWAADSFEGMPIPDKLHFPADANYDWSKIKELKISLEEVKNNFSKYNLLDNQVKFLKGWFKYTLPKAPINQLAILRLDADLYESTLEALTFLYPKLSIGGYVIIDDFLIIPCKKAVLDYRTKHDITDRIEKIDNDSIFWKKTK